MIEGDYTLLKSIFFLLFLSSGILVLFVYLPYLLIAEIVRNKKQKIKSKSIGNTNDPKPAPSKVLKIIAVWFLVMINYSAILYFFTNEPSLANGAAINSSDAKSEDKVYEAGNEPTNNKEQAELASDSAPAQNPNLGAEPEFDKVESDVEFSECLGVKQTLITDHLARDSNNTSKLVMDKDDLKIDMLCSSDGAVLVSCSEPDHKMTILELPDNRGCQMP